MEMRSPVLISFCLLLSTACANEGSAESGETVGETAPVVVEVALGSRHSCARLESGAIECWGAGGAGQLGDGVTLEDSTYPVAVTGLDDPITQLAAGGGHTCALTEGGGVSCWGLDVDGQLGDGSPYADQAAPVGVFGFASAGIRSIGAGSLTSCATTNDKLVCWGGDWFGQVGDGEDQVNPSSPVILDGLAGVPVAVDVDQRVGCVLLDSGEVQCWGQCWFGTLGIGLSEPDACYSVSAPEDPVQLSGPAQAISVGDVHACALLESGTVQCWGGNEYGQLGDGSFVQSDVPVDVALPGIATGLATGSNFSCALLEDGEVACWGENLDGQLGIGTFGPPHASPELIDDLDGAAVAIAAAGWHACAIVESGGLQCWGSDHRGQLGDGPPFESKSSPTPVLGLGEGLDGSVETGGVSCADQVDPGLGVPASLGSAVVHWTTLDQHGDEFALCDLAGRPILIDISTSWCTPCQGMAEWLSNGAGIDNLAPWAPLRDLVAREKFHWLTILIEGPDGNPSTVEDAANWDMAYPNDKVPVVIDPMGEIVPGQFWASGYPGFALINARFRWDGIDGNSLTIAGEKYGP